MRIKLTNKLFNNSKISITYSLSNSFDLIKIKSKFILFFVWLSCDLLFSLEFGFSCDLRNVQPLELITAHRH